MNKILSKFFSAQCVQRCSNGRSFGKNCESKAELCPEGFFARYQSYSLAWSCPSRRLQRQLQRQSRRDRFFPLLSPARILRLRWRGPAPRLAVALTSALIAARKLPRQNRPPHRNQSLRQPQYISRLHLQQRRRKQQSRRRRAVARHLAARRRRKKKFRPKKSCHQSRLLRLKVFRLLRHQRRHQVEQRHQNQQQHQQLQ